MKRFATVLTLLLTLALVFASRATSTQAEAPPAEAEPNNTCQTAQDLSALGTSFTLDGETPTVPYPPPSDYQPEFDYFKVPVTAGTFVSVSVGGSASGVGSLGAMVMTIQRSCEAIADAYPGGGWSPDPAINYPVVNQGAIIIGVRANILYPSGFVVGGTYQLVVGVVPPAGSVNGRVLDSSGVALANTPYVLLQRCRLGICASLVLGSIDSQGRFSFINSFPERVVPPADVPVGDYPQYMDLPSGDYQVSVNAPGYQPYDSPIFSLTDSQHLVLGEIRLAKIPGIGSISGQLVDGYTGEPLGNVWPSYASVNLLRCAEFGCYYTSAYSTVDSQGRFTFYSQDPYWPLEPGTYVVKFGASDYLSGETEPFVVAEGQQFDLGTVKVYPQPVKVRTVTDCQPIPATGGTCSWSAELINRLPTSTKLNIWAVYSVSQWAPVTASLFQPEPAQQFVLRPGESRLVRFRLDVPADVRPGTSFCATLYATEATRGSYFSPQSTSSGVCGFKEPDGVFRPMTVEETARQIQALSSPARPSRGMNGVR